MGFKEIIKKIQKDYVVRRVVGMNLPSFKVAPLTREHIVFTGRVQKIGFRMEMNLIAQRIGLTGWVKNNDSGSVEAEVQGGKDKIDFLKQQMKSLKRAKVLDIETRELPVIENEKSFTVLRTDLTRES
ncbi:MAG: acylphosphatase [Eubacteriales bacterium]|nr:acylphosphatase [Eubacteriales bacterium]